MEKAKEKRERGEGGEEEAASVKLALVKDYFPLTEIPSHSASKW